ncbi:Gfo/Idh/MocA family protein [Thorsellia kenyensis]|uniref:Gfo/Idh/MocA family protein n=1 Tax=Thorsellia kenyensis TaxID=1549888 RepID=A0ABV6C8K4_9GAMM
MIHLAIIGTNWITDRFLDAAIKSQEFVLTAVYSREKAKAESFAKTYDNFESIRLYDDLSLVCADDKIAAVYIASPNSFHADQAIQCMQAGKHVIVEKPIASNSQQIQLMIETAIKNNVVLFEAFKTQYLPNFQILKSALPAIGQIRLANLSYCQYSSRYPKYLAGELPNTFNPEFSNGSLMDIGFYCLSTAIALWGKPKNINACAVKLDSGVDALGIVNLIYDDFLVNILHSKVSDGVTCSEIQGENGTISIEAISECKKITHINRHDKSSHIISTIDDENSMVYEARYFAHLIKNKEINHQDLLRSQTVIEIIDKIRTIVQIEYPCDNK